MDRILVLGYFGYQTNQLDGQTVKTRDVYRLISEHHANTVFYDTQEFQTRRWSVFRMLGMVARSRSLVYLPAQNNLKYVFPFIWLVAKLFGVKVHYFVIGGWLSLFLKKLPLHRFLLRRIDGIYSETARLKQELEDWYGMKNVGLFHNFRYFDFQPAEHHTQGELHIVFMARVCRAKGLDMIFSFGDYAGQNGLSEHVSVDFYGPIKEEDRAYFFNEVSRFPFMSYKGVLQPEDVHRNLHRYDVLVLPTHYPGEGLPGSVIDAYIAGLPVIVTRWAYATEFVEEGVSGIIVPYEDGQEAFDAAIVSLLGDEEKLSRMKVSANQYGMRFSEKVAWENLQSILFSSKCK